MITAGVAILHYGSELKTVQRPLWRAADGRRVVKFKGRLWPLDEAGAVHLERGPLDEGEAAGLTPARDEP